MQVINAKTGLPEELDPVATTEGLAAGTHLPPAGQGVLFNPDGGLVFVPGEDVSENVARYGYKVPSPDDLRKAGRDFTYGTDTAQLQAGLAGAARGGTFGVSDYLAVKTGLTSPEHLSALKEYYPDTSLATELMGGVATAFVPASPVGMLVKGAKLAEATAVGKAAAMLPKSQAASAIANLAVETGGKALGGAIEGMAFGLGQSVSESALGDPDLTAEKVMANVGYGGLLGGGLGAAFHVGGLGVKKAFEQSKKAYAKAYESLVGKSVLKEVGGPTPSVFDQVGAEAGDVAETIGGIADEAATTKEVFEPGYLSRKAAKAASITSGKPEQEILANLQAQMDPTKIVLTTAQKDALVTEFTTSVDDIYKNLDKLTRKVSGKYRPQETAALLKDAELYEPLRQLQSLQDDLTSAVKLIESKPSEYSANKKAKFANILKEMESKPIESYKNANEVFRDLDKRKAQLQKMQKFKKRLESMANEVEVDTITDIISPMVDKVKSGLESGTAWGEAGARQAAFNNKISEFIASKEGLEQFLMRESKVGKGRPIMEIDPAKANTFFNQINDNRAKFRNRAVMNFLKAGREVIDEIEKTSGNVPGQKLDIAGVKNFVEKTSEQALKAKDVVSSTFGGHGYFRDLMDAAKSGGLAGMAAQIGTAFTNPENIIKGLSTIESLSRKTSKAVETTSKFIFEKVRPPTRGAGVIIEKMTNAERLEKYQKTVERLKNLTDVPDAMLDQIDAATKDTFEYAPKITQGLQLAAVRATSFLASKVPQPPDKGILDQPYQPSQAQIITFMRYADAVENPLVALKQLEANAVNSETLETLKTVYPSLYGDMKQSIIGSLADKMAEGKVDLPYQRRAVLSRFLEMPLDSSFRPEIVARNQEALAALSAKEEAKEQAEQSIRPTQKGASNVSLSSRSQSITEKVSSRA